jgi:dynein heavy chain
MQRSTQRLAARSHGCAVAHALVALVARHTAAAAGRRPPAAAATPLAHLLRFATHRSSNLKQINELLENGPAKLFVHYQAPPEGGTDPVFFLSDGESVKLSSKCCFFMRNTAAGEPVNPDVGNDGTLIFGELCGTALRSVETMLANVFQPLLKEQSFKGWGQTDDTQKQEFHGKMDKFVVDLQEALRSQLGGIELAKPDPNYDYDIKSFPQKVVADKNMLTHFEDLLESWCVSIEQVINQTDAVYTEAEQDTETDVGPMSELEYWRQHMRRLTSIMEQLKTKECKSVIACLSALTKNPQDQNRQKLFSLLRRWKEIDINITEAANEAKDNVKYLFTLERFLAPLYSGTPTTIVDTIPALMNSIKMMYTIARYYNTNERMTKLFVKCTQQMIENCKQDIVKCKDFDAVDLSDSTTLWDQDPLELVNKLQSCLLLNEAYQDQYHQTQELLKQSASTKKFDFDEKDIFSRFDLFCRRVIKLIDMFGTIHQFSSLAERKLEGMEVITARFWQIIKDFKRKRHNLLNFQDNKFDRDYVEFNVQISELEQSLQLFIDESFLSITSIDRSLSMLRRFQSIFQRDSLKSNLESKFYVIFMNYGAELEEVQNVYEKCKQNPPIPRNLPPVAGNITWSRHLLKRVEEPMKLFEQSPTVLASKDAKRVIRLYNKVARTLVAFEYLWYQAWVQSIDAAKSGLQATLIVRHPDDSRLYVNFDHEIVQLIREARCLNHMGIEIPESAKIVLLQENKYKAYFHDLQYALIEHDRIKAMVIPVTAMLLLPQFNDMEFKIRPGMITLSWTSMNIDMYAQNVQQGLTKLEELVATINDIIEHRVEKNLKKVSRITLVDLPNDRSFTLEQFHEVQRQHLAREELMMTGKNIEIEHAVEDLIKIIITYPLDPHIETTTVTEMDKLRKHYNTFMYQALLHATKSSLGLIKSRVGKLLDTGFLYVMRPFFEVDVTLAIPSVSLHPSLNDIQTTINQCSKEVLYVNSKLWDWGQSKVPDDQKKDFFDRITQDIEIVRVVLLLTGSVQGTKNQVTEFLDDFKKYDWMWKEDKIATYKEFIDSSPQLEDYEKRLQHFVEMELEIEHIHSLHNLGALSLNMKNLKTQLVRECQDWKMMYSENLRKDAKGRMESLFEYMRITQSKLNREVVDLESLRFVMNVLKEVREKESEVDLEINPITYMYVMLENYLPEGFIPKKEMDDKSVLQSQWRKLVHLCEIKTDELSKTQVGFRRQLLKDVKDFVVDVKNFRKDYIENGPNPPGETIKPMEAVERLNRFKEEFRIRDRKYDLYSGGEDLFALPTTDYPDLVKTKKDLDLQDKLFGLYLDVLNTISEYKLIPWINVPENIDVMQENTDGFASRCKKMPKSLREWEAYKELAKVIEDFSTVLPLLSELSKASIMPRHWEEIMEITHTEFDVESGDFKLQTLLDAKIENFKDDIEEITEGADKQLKIEQGLKELDEIWAVKGFDFMEWKGRGVSILKGIIPVVEELEEAQMQLQTMLTMRHVTPFRERAQAKLGQLSDTSETLEKWQQVQILWCSLESVFTGGDIAKQMPQEAKKFAKIDKDFAKMMAKASETIIVVDCCENELLKNSLPVMYNELEKCQKSLEGYLEQKQKRFPRFYFVSNPKLLLILSQGSDPLSMNQYYENVFDSIFQVVHNAKDKTIITTILAPGGQGAEVVPFSTPLLARGNIEDWLALMLKAMQTTMKDICRNCSVDIERCASDIKALRSYVDTYIAQFALLGIQLLWTAETQSALEQCKSKKTIMKECNQKQIQVLTELSSWCLQDLGAKPNRIKIETMVTIHVHQRDTTNDLNSAYKQKKISDANDFLWLSQARFYWRTNQSDECDADGACVTSICDADFNYQYEYLGSKERLVVTPLTDRCYITLAQALNMYFGGAPAGPAGTGKTETVKDLGRTLGIYVVVTNCGDQMNYMDCAKIFKGLCQGGIWGCFDEFNRIQLPVLSVVAQQVLAIQDAKKSAAEFFLFPGDPQQVILLPVCGFFITMNPGYAGRQELPENLKALFRGVAMMVPNFQIIMKVKLCAVGYSEYPLLAKKFFILYNTCKEQLSAQKHYDWGLRNILSVLRTAGGTKRINLEQSEEYLMYQTLRDMNLSKLVAQDVPLFLSLLADLFPSCSPPDKGEYPNVMTALRKNVEAAGLVNHENWISKVIQLYETTRVRHGIMLCGPTGGGKTRIFEMLMKSLEDETVLGVVHKQSRFNPKAIRAAEMYGEIDSMSGEWTTGVYAAMWAKFNSRANKFNTWIIADGPVDAIWIEDLNTVLDDNRLLTLANGDRMPMTDNVKMMFEVETLVNASPATVSRAGIIYISDTDLDWAPVVESWVLTRPADQQELLRPLFKKYLGENSPVDPGHMIDFLNRHTSQVISVSRVGQGQRLCNLLFGLLEGEGSAFHVPDPTELERLFLYCLTWALGGGLEPEDRAKFDAYLRKFDDNQCLPDVDEGQTVYEFYVEPSTLEWKLWRPPKWTYPNSEKLDFSNLLVPTMDSTRSLFIIENLHKNRKPVLLVGGSGTAKTSTAFIFMNGFDPDDMLQKNVNFSSATTPGMFQATVEAELDKRGGKNFGPPNGKSMTFFIDDISMPLVNDWGDQPTLEAVRQVVEYNGFCFLDKDKRGDFKVCEDLQYLGAMAHPGGGKNDIPNRLKRQFFLFNLTAPSKTSINDIYGQMLNGRFTSAEYDAPTLETIGKFTQATIDVWDKMKGKMLPTPAKFHYVFNMRELSRVFQGILATPAATITSGGGVRVQEKVIAGLSPESMMVALWKHECERVFCDKLTNMDDKDWYIKFMDKHISSAFGDVLGQDTYEPIYLVSFLREDVYDDDGVFESFAPKVYESGGTLQDVRDRVMVFLGRHNEEFPQKKMELVLFNDALKHLLRISRLIELPRGSAMLVGVGGSGKQSLTRLASYIANSFCFQITLTKQYNTASLMEDLRTLYKSAGHQRKQTTFLFTESEIKSEIFLELINSVLMTGEVAGLFAKDEMMGMTADLHNAFVKERPGLEETQANLKQFFTDCARDNLHLVLCMSPMNPLFPERARKFPGITSAPTIDWFLPWPEDALVAVSQGFIRDFPIECDPDTKECLMVHMGNVHAMADEVCKQYFQSVRRNVYQTPKSYLSFIAAYKDMYTVKLGGIKEKEGRVNLGLQKLVGGAKDVEDMKVVLQAEQVKLKEATEATNKMLGSLEISSAEANKEGEEVEKIKVKCIADAARIAAEKSACAADLAKAQPFVDQAEEAISSIKESHIKEVKLLKTPADVLKLVFDGVLILFGKELFPVQHKVLNIAKQEVPFLEPSFFGPAQKLMNSSFRSCSGTDETDFLKNVQLFGAIGKDKMNAETVEFLHPYCELEGYFVPAVAKNASSAGEGLCAWIIAMKDYFYASKIVKPKLEALSIAAAQMDTANKALAAAEERLAGVKARLAELQQLFEASMAEKKRIEDGAAALQRKMQQASDLIGGLAGERTRWTEDANNFADLKRRLVGDCAVACAFVSYCGPFNQEFRKFCVEEKFTNDCKTRKVPVTADIEIVSFLVDEGTIGDWNMEGLPRDILSVQNGILVTRSSRYPMLIDPQGQASKWIRTREENRMPSFGTTAINHPKLKDQLEFAMGEGKALIILGVEETVDPMLDPVLEKQIIYKGKGKMSINVSDKNMDFSPDFSMYFVTRLPNPHFSPELQAKTTLVDFTVTQRGLEEQLLGLVIGKEQKALEEQLNQVLEEVNSNTKALLQLDASLLQRLTSNTGNLLEDEELIGVLANTKAKAAEVKDKLIAADETKRNINEKREQFRPVATRGSVLYFSIVEMSLVNIMYQTSLPQFLGLFMQSMDDAEKANLASKRVANVIDTMTYIAYRYINRGLYETHKLLFVLLTTLKILVTNGDLSAGDVTLFLRGGAGLDINATRRKPFNWISNEAWLNVMQMSQSCKFFSQLPNEMSGNEMMWRRWYEDNEPEAMMIPDYEQRLSESEVIGPFLKMLLVRSLRMDRTQLSCKSFIRGTPAMGVKFVEPVTDTIDSIFDGMVAEIPVVFLLSTGADPTDSISLLARKRKAPPPATVSLGEGQAVVAIRAMNAAAANGTWVLLQNCELGLDLMDQMEDFLGGLVSDPGFRLFITALPTPGFPLGLLQMSTKVTNEPPSGLQAGILRSYTVMIDQDRLERVESVMWRQLLFCLCFLHSTVQERRKFGPLGWCIPYEFNNGDFSACIQFLEKHLYNGPISWPTLQYMVSEAQYGGKITDDLDRRMFGLYTKAWLNPKSCTEEFTFNPANPLFPIPKGFVYKVPVSDQVTDLRAYCSSMPEIDSPEVFGLHPNADLTFRVKDVNALFSTMSETQPKGGGGGGGVSKEDAVFEKATDLLEKLPEDYVEDDYKVKILKLGGLSIPLNIFLYQEIQRLQRVIAKVRFVLSQMQMAIRGEVVMTEELQNSLDAIAEAGVPTSWMVTITGDEFSWIIRSLGLWYSSLMSRDEQNRTWLHNNRPNCYWLTGFFNPQGMLTAMKQEVTRKHKAQKWALDDVVYHTETTVFDRPDKVSASPPEGVYIHGLYLEGCTFSKSEGTLVESEPKKLFTPLPVLFVTGNIFADETKKRKEQYGSVGPFECPCYKYTARTDRYIIFMVTLRCTAEKNPVHWGLRGAALLCNTD